jgi:SAM-dependent methyltransferase
MAVWQWKIALRAWLRPEKVHAPRVLWVDPRRIQQAGVGWTRPSGPDVAPRSAGGDWDRRTVPIDQLDLYRGLVARFCDGHEWAELSPNARTQLVADYAYNTPSGPPLDAFAAADGLHAWLTAGKRSARSDEVARNAAAAHLAGIAVRIGRDGALLADGGRAALILAQVLGIPNIPVRVSWRHTEWQLFRLQLQALAAASWGMTYQPLLHPDLAAIPAGHGDARFNLIRAHLGVPCGTLLDIGANLGYFCHKFEDEGFDCFAVDENYSLCYFMDRLRRAEGKRFHIINVDVLDFSEKTEFDVVLALNIFHHFVRDVEQHRKLIGFLRRLRASVMFLEPHLQDEPQMRGAYWNPAPDEFVGFVAEHARLSGWIKLGEAEYGRPLYRLTA